MNRISHTITALSIFASTTAFAQEAKKDENKDEKKLTPYGLIQAKAWLLQSDRAAGIEGDVEILRAGLRGSHGMAKAGIEAEMLGNNTTVTSNTTATNGTVTVRAAWLGLELPTKTVAKIGRVRPGSAGAWGTDSTTTVQGYSGVDGLHIKQTITLPADGTVELGGGLFNSLRVLPIQGTSTKNNMRQSPQVAGSWNKPGKAWIGNVAVSHSDVKAQLWYGMEMDGIVKANYKVAQGTENRADASTLDQVSVADLSHLEASLGYDKDNWGVGLFMEQDVKGQQTLGTLNSENGKLTLGDKDSSAGNPKVTQTIYGVGVNLNSKEFGIADLLTKDDAITFGAGYVRGQRREAGLSDSLQEGSDSNEFSGYVGYTVSKLEVALGAISTSSAKMENKDADGKPRHSKVQTYINTAWEF